MLRKQLSYATFTDVGDREINEDSLCAMERDGKYCFAVCDGLGGHGMGDAASRLVVEVFQEMFEKTEDMSSFLPQAIQASQDILMAEQKRLDVSHKMKTTVAAMVSDGKRAYIGHVGDSRVYVFRHNKVLRRTLDHSIPQMLVLTREIKEEEIRNHPDRNVLLQSVGTEWEEPMYELMRPVPLWRCQGFLLCSDGFWELIDEEKMCALLRESASPEEWLRRMAAVVKENGTDREMDNYSATAVWCT